MNELMVVRVAKAICFAARMNKEFACPICYGIVKQSCTMADQFEDEAKAAIKEIKGR